MSILKGIMHHWNKTKNDYDVIHPETDYKKITDWNEGIVATLASTALGNLVSTMTSDSLLAKMIQLVLTATGVKYSTGQNGYLCFGSLGGGTIIQWGVSYESQTLTLPIQSKILVITGMHEGNTKQTVSYSQSENKWVGSDKSLYLFYIAICK